MTDFAPAHPGWCSPNRCDVTDPTLPTRGGAHRSEPITLDLAPVLVGRDRLQVATASLYRVDHGFDTDTWLILNAAGREQLSMPILKSTAVLVQLARLIGQGESA